MNVDAPVEVRCQGTYRGRPCRRFLGAFRIADGGIVCPTCGKWNEVEIDKTEKVC